MSGRERDMQEPPIRSYFQHFYIAAYGAHGIFIQDVELDVRPAAELYEAVTEGIVRYEYITVIKHPSAAAARTQRIMRVSFSSFRCLISRVSSKKSSIFERRASPSSIFYIPPLV